MASFSPLVQQLIDALRCLPGVGYKSAQRMALYLLERDRDGGRGIAENLHIALAKVGHCQSCRTLSETTRCAFCCDKRRDASLLCIVESPADVFAIEQTGDYRGQYFVLQGHLSPLDGIGPQELGMQHLLGRLTQGGIKEIIIATNHTVEGEATAHYIIELTQALPIVVSRLASGIPMGGELEYLDGGTLMQALQKRTRITSGQSTSEQSVRVSNE